MKSQDDKGRDERDFKYQSMQEAKNAMGDMKEQTSGDSYIKKF